MYLKSTHTCLLDGNHQWEVTLFCSAEANTIKSVDIVPKSRGAKVVPNDAKPAPTAYTMIYTTSSTVKSDNHIPYQFSATITFLKSNEKKTVSVPANMATDRKRRKADFNDNNNGQFDQSNSNHDIEGEVEDVSPPPPPPKDEKIKRSWKCFNCLGTVSQRKKKTGENMDEKGEIDDGGIG
ncbi:10496_t:CDS:2 [Ambispora gerdemannii]|uniref:10496_t:CDS:1 n=1 Tax=Ambispora gerdemannii TaxID=144530 RepID=A0A9N8V3R2_9GLOM|nr:10496_t:CDS:2 [Ambispora gerdemannii]